MPFYTPSNEPKHEIDFNRYKPITVTSYCSFSGEIKPLAFRYISDDESETTFKIDSIKFTKEIKGGFSYCCLFNNHGRQQEVILIFYVMEHLWVILR